MFMVLTRSPSHYDSSLTLVLLIFRHILHTTLTGGKMPLGLSLSRVPRHLRTKFQRLHPCFRGLVVQWCCRRYHRKSPYTGNRYGGAQTGSNTVSAHRTDRNIIPTSISIFSMSPGSTTLSLRQPEVALYRK